MATGRLIAPAGTLLSSHGRPVDVALGHDGKTLFVKANKEVWVANSADMSLQQTLEIPDGASLYGIATSKSDDLYVTNSKGSLLIYSPAENKNNEATSRYELKGSVDLTDDSFPCGIILSPDEKQAFVCLSKKNSVAVVDLATKTVAKEIPVGVAPFDLVLAADGKLLVSNIGGRQATKEDKTATSGGTKTVIDDRGVASTGTVSVVDLDHGTVEADIQVGLHPSTICRCGNRAIVCNTNEDSVSVIDVANSDSKKFVVKPDEKLPFGSMPSAVAMSPDGSKLFVALAGNNAVCALDVAADGTPNQIGLIPTAWYPASLVCSKTDLFIGNVKGIGSRSVQRDKQEGWNTHDFQGTVQKVALSDATNTKTLKQWTETVQKNSRIPQILRSLVNEERDPSVEPRPVPEKRGQPSVFKHVIYVIKENRTFDQVFGDVKEARSDPRLCVFPEEIAPNHHALAKRFGLLDNYYCNGVLSADGHSWATEGNVTPYLERAFGGFARSYTFGDDPITYSSSGFLWDHILAAGLSFRNYGEMDYAKQPDGMKYVDIYQAFQKGQQVEFGQNIGVERLRRYSCRDYPGWNLRIPDVLRIDRFMKELKEFEGNEGLPNLCIVYLPQDHLGGEVVSRSHMADNDLALGRLVDAVSHSKYWKDTVIFVNEDDPQNGYDHIDGHRSLCLVISPYGRPGINHSFYNQTSVLRTMLHLFGLPPMNQQDASMPLMGDCFQATANLSPYDAILANFALDELPGAKNSQSSIEQKWRLLLATVPIERTGMKTEQDEDNLNRFVWHEMRGWDTPYPVEWAGSHARGLQALGLKVESDQDE